MYLDSQSFTLNLKNVGFSGCTSTVNCGAFFSNCDSVNMTNVCGFQCQAFHSDFQFFSIKVNNDQKQNFIDMLAVSFCGMRDQGNTALSFNGSTSSTTQYVMEYINSTNNYNFYNDQGYGSCIRFFDYSSPILFLYFNFYLSAGADVMNMLGPFDSGVFSYGTFYNNTVNSILSYCGTNEFNKTYFLSNICTSFRINYVGSSSSTNQLTLTWCFFDWDIYNYTLLNGNLHRVMTSSNYRFATRIPNLPLLDNCPIPPTLPFTKSDFFSSSHTFSESRVFSSTKKFTATSAFSKTEAFTKSDSFYPSKSFSPSNLPTPTNTFTPSDPFTPSFTFSPMATKYPDGINYRINALVKGEEIEQKASPAAIGVTTGLSAVTISVSVVLMLMYLKTRTSQVQTHKDPDCVFSDSTEPDSSYSYSFYTYDDSYSNSKEGSPKFTDIFWSFYSSNYSYSSFEGAYVSTSEQIP